MTEFEDNPNQEERKPGEGVFVRKNPYSNAGVTPDIRSTRARANEAADLMSAMRKKQDPRFIGLDDDLVNLQGSGDIAPHAKSSHVSRPGEDGIGSTKADRAGDANRDTNNN